MNKKAYNGRFNSVNSQFWVDNYTSNLDPIEKLLFLYFLTNTQSNIAGVYQIPIKNIAVETGIDRDMVTKILARFEKDRKIFYKDGYIIIRNKLEFNKKDNDSIYKGAMSIIESLPNEIRVFHNEVISYGQSGDSLVTEGVKRHVNVNANDNDNDISTVFIEKWNSKDYVVKIAKMTAERKAKFNARLKDKFFADNYLKAIDLMDNSDFLKGGTERKGHERWKPDFDFFMRPNTVLKIIEGNYGIGEKVKVSFVTNSKALYDYYVTLWGKTYQDEYISVDIEADVKRFSDLLKNIGEDKHSLVAQKLKKYFDNNDKFYVGARHNIGLFVRVFSTL